LTATFGCAGTIVNELRSQNGLRNAEAGATDFGPEGHGKLDAWRAAVRRVLPSCFGVGGLILNLAGATLAELGDEEQRGCADRGADDRAGSSGTKMDTDLRTQPTACKGAKNSDYYVADPAAGSTNTDTFDRRVHSGPLTEICLNSYNAGPGELRLPERASP
jgi:hypothetical protein